MPAAPLCLSSIAAAFAMFGTCMDTRKAKILLSWDNLCHAHVAQAPACIAEGL